MAVVGDPETWEQEFWLELVDSDGSRFVQLTGITAGKVQITILDAETGDTRYWNGTEFVTTSTILNTTIIGGKLSRYDFVIPDAARGRVIVFEGWGVRNGKETPRRRREVAVQTSGDALYDFKFGPS